MFQVLNKAFRSYIDASTYITVGTPLSEQAGDIVNTVLSNSSLSKSIFESEHGKVHVKKPPPGVLIIDGVTMAKPVAISTFHTTAAPGNHF